MTDASLTTDARDLLRNAQPPLGLGLRDRMEWCEKRDSLLRSAPEPSAEQLRNDMARVYMRLQCADVPRDPWHWEVCSILNGDAFFGGQGSSGEPREQPTLFRYNLEWGAGLADITCSFTRKASG